MTLINIYEELCAGAVKNNQDLQNIDLDLATFVKTAREGADLSYRWTEARQRMYIDVCKKLGISIEKQV